MAKTKVEKILSDIKRINSQGHKPVTLLGVCPNSISVIKAAFRAAKRNDCPMIFVATLNQVDCDGGYTGMTQEDFVKVLKREARRNNYSGEYIIAIDHGGPWLKDKQTLEKWTLEEAMQGVMRSFEAALDAGYDMIHVDPTVDRTLSPGNNIKIETVAERTLRLISHIEDYRRAKGYPRISYEVGTEEVHGGLADENIFNSFLTLLQEGLKKSGYSDVWPDFIVGKVGTDLHTAFFDPKVARKLTEKVAEYGSYIKGHYTDDVENPQDYPLCGIGAANVGPEFTLCEYNALKELEAVELKLYEKGNVAMLSGITSVIEKLVVASGRWKKWILEGESAEDFYSIPGLRRLWLIGTGARYIWQEPHAVTARMALYSNLSENGIDAEEIVLSRIERSIDKYCNAFNLVNLNENIARLYT